MKELINDTIKKVSKLERMLVADKPEGDIIALGEEIAVQLRVILNKEDISFLINPITVSGKNSFYFASNQLIEFKKDIGLNDIRQKVRGEYKYPIFSFSSLKSNKLKIIPPYTYTSSDETEFAVFTNEILEKYRYNNLTTALKKLL